MSALRRRSTAHASTTGSLGPMKILIAEDNRVSLQLLQSLLIRAGHEVIAATDGEQALAVLEREDAPQFVILDWDMPLLNGLEICRSIRRSGRHAYVIIYTARPALDFEEAHAAGADEVIEKTKTTITAL